MKAEISMLGLSVIILWGLWGFLYKYGVIKLGLFRAIFVTSVVYLVLNVAIISYLYYHGVGFPIETTSIALSLGTIFGVGAGLLFMYALQKYPGSIVIPLTALYPGVSAVLAILILKEEIKAMNSLGIVLAVVAGYLLIK